MEKKKEWLAFSHWVGMFGFLIPLPRVEVPTLFTSARRSVVLHCIENESYALEIGDLGNIFLFPLLNYCTLFWKILSRLELEGTVVDRECLEGGEEAVICELVV